MSHVVGFVSIQQRDPPDEELLSSALQSVEVELGKLAEIPWLYHILHPNDEEVRSASIVESAFDPVFILNLPRKEPYTVL